MTKNELIVDLIVMFFVWLVYYFAYRLYESRENTWAQKHPGLYKDLFIGILQFPIMVIVGYFIGYEAPILWCILYAVSFLIFILCYMRWHKICRETVSTVADDEESFIAHCIVCGRNFDLCVRSHVNKVGCPVCGNQICRADWVKIEDITENKCPFCGKGIELSDGSCPHCGHIIVTHV